MAEVFSELINLFKISLQIHNIKFPQVYLRTFIHLTYTRVFTVNNILTNEHEKNFNLQTQSLHLH